MTTLMRFAAAIALMLAVVGGFLVLRSGDRSGVGGAPPGSSTPSPSASTAPGAISVPALDQTFTSSRHGYSIGYPSGWTTTAATRPWTGEDGPDTSAGNMDTLAGSQARLVIESAPLGSQTPDEWSAAYVARFGLDGVGECDVLPPNWPHIQIGGRPGFLDGNDCPGDGSVVANDRFFEALAFVDGRVYLFWIQGEVDRAYFDAMLATVAFNAGAAKDGP